MAKSNINGSNEKRKKTQKSDQHKSPWFTLFIEVVSIVMGVLLALGVNEWRENNSLQEQADFALKNIKNEIRSNYNILEIIHKNNTEVMNLISSKNITEDINKRNFIPGLQLRETSWQTMLSTGVSEHVNYETVIKLSETYSFQYTYKQTGESLTQAAMNMSAFAAANGREVKNEDFINQFKEYFKIMITVESELLSNYQAAISHIDSLEM